MVINYAAIKGFLIGIKPVDILTVSEWADKYRWLSSKAAAMPGPWRTSVAPYLKAIQDALTANNGIERVVVKKGAQLGLTEAGNNWLGYVIHINPGPALMVMPTVDTMKRNSEIRIDPMIEATPVLQEKIKEKRSRDSGNKMLQKDFPGGILMMAGANSAAGLRSMPVRDLMLDEVDGYPANVEGEGSPISLALARTRTFKDRKIYIISTPTLKGTSVICVEFEATEQNYFMVPCPHCGTAQKLEWERIKWDKTLPEPEQPASVYYECAEVACAGHIFEHNKEEMLAAGYWQAEKPENKRPDRIGFHINTLYSPFYPWNKVVEDYLEALKNTLLMITFTNTVLGLEWAGEGEAPDWEILYDRREEFNGEASFSNKVGVITAGADIQKDRIECEVVGWGEGNESYSLGYYVLLGDTEQAEVWQQLADLLDTQFTREDGQQLTISTMAIDTGYLATSVYTFAALYPASRVFPVKGQDAQRTMISAPQAVQKKISGKRAGTTKLINIGVSVLKAELYGWLKRKIDSETGEIPAGYCHFPTLYDTHYFKMLTAEKLVYVANKKGFGKYEWVKTFERNEALDCRVYARAAALLAGIEQVSADGWRGLVGAGISSAPPVAAAAVKPGRAGSTTAAKPASASPKPPAKKASSITKGRFSLNRR